MSIDVEASVGVVVVEAKPEAAKAAKVAKAAGAVMDQPLRRAPEPLLRCPTTRGTRVCGVCSRRVRLSEGEKIRERERERERERN